MNAEASTQASEKKSWHYFLRLLHLTRPHAWLLSGALLGMGLASFAMVAEPRVLGWVVDQGILAEKPERVRQLAVLFLALQAVRGLSLALQSYWFEKLGQRVLFALRVRLFSHLQEQSVTFFDRQASGRLATRLTHDIASLSELFSIGIVSFLGNVLFILGSVAWLAVMDWRLAALALSVLPPLGWITWRSSQLLHLAYRDAREKLSGLNAFLAETLGGAKVLQVLNQTRAQLARFERHNDEYAHAQAGSIRVYAFFQPAITVASGLALALLIYPGGVLTAEVSTGVWVAFFAYALSLFQPLRELADKWNVLLSGLASAERVFSLLDGEGTGLDGRSPPPDVIAGWRGPVRSLRESGVGRGHWVFEKVGFRYGASSDWALRDLSFEIRPGEKVAVVGPTGAGKSTLTGLLLRFQEPQEGKIWLDGRELRDYDPRALRRWIGLVQQESLFFSGPLINSIWSERWLDSTLGVEKMPCYEQARSVLARLGCAHWLEQPGLLLEERGANLSMGERQVLAFVRVLVRDPGFWILDEATAHLDSVTEKNLERELRQAASSSGDGAVRGTLLVAHRLSTVVEADKICVLNRGSLVEEGAHTDLLARGGLYSLLFRHQLLERAER